MSLGRRSARRIVRKPLSEFRRAEMPVNLELARLVKSDECPSQRALVNVRRRSWQVEPQ